MLFAICEPKQFVLDACIGPRVPWDLQGGGGGQIWITGQKKALFANIKEYWMLCDAFTPFIHLSSVIA